MEPGFAASEIDTSPVRVVSAQIWWIWAGVQCVTANEAVG